MADSIQYASTEATNSFLSLSDERKREALAKMSPNAKQALLATLKTRNVNSNNKVGLPRLGYVHEKADNRMFTAPDASMTTPKQGQVPTGREMVRKGLRTLPTLGGIAGAALGTGWGSVPGALIGGAAGESLEQMGEHAMGEGPKTSGEASERIGKEGLIQGANELGGKALSYPAKALGKTMTKLATKSARVPLLPSEAGIGGSGVKATEGFLSHALPSAGIMDRFRGSQSEAAIDAITDEIANISSFHGSSEQLGKMANKAVSKGRDRLKTEVGNAYGEIDKLTASQVKRVPVSKEVTSSIVDEAGKPMSFQKRVLEKQNVGGVQPSTTPAKKAAVVLLRRLKEQEKFMDPKLLADTRSILEGIIHAPRSVPYKTLADSRSDLLAIARKLDDPLPGKRAGIAKLLGRETDEAMMAAAEKSGIPDLPEKIRAANAMTKAMHEKFNQDLVTKILETKKPEMVSGFLRTAGHQEIRDLYAIITQPQRRALQSQVMKDVLKESIDANTGRIDTQKFAKAILGMEDRGGVLFGANYARIQELGELLNKVGQKGTPGTIAQLHNWSYLRALPVAVVTAGLGHPMAAMLEAGATGAETTLLVGLAKAITNPARSAKVLNAFRAVAHGTPYAINGLNKLLSDESGMPEGYGAGLPPLEPSHRSLPALGAR